LPITGTAEAKDAVWYAIPWIPFLTRSLLSLVYRQHMRETLPEEALDRDSYRTMILAFAGFSFTGLLGVAVVDSMVRYLDLRMSSYFLMVSFVTFLAAYDLQGYKCFRWQDQLGDALVESARLALIFSVLVVEARHANPAFMVVTMGALVLFSVDHLTRLYIVGRFLHLKGKTGGAKR